MLAVLQREHLLKLPGGVGSVGLLREAGFKFLNQLFAAVAEDRHAGFGQIVDHADLFARQRHEAFTFALGEADGATDAFEHHEALLHAALVADELGHTHRAVINKTYAHAQVIPLSQQAVVGEAVAHCAAGGTIGLHGGVERLDGGGHFGVVLRCDAFEHRVGVVYGVLQLVPVGFFGRTGGEQCFGLSDAGAHLRAHLLGQSLVAQSQRAHQLGIEGGDVHVAVVVHVADGAAQVAAGGQTHGENEVGAVAVQCDMFGGSVEPGEEGVAVLQVPHEELFAVHGGAVIGSDLGAVVHAVAPPEVAIGAAHAHVAALDEKPVIITRDEVFAVAFAAHLEGDVVLSGGLHGEAGGGVREHALRSAAVVGGRVVRRCESVAHTLCGDLHEAEGEHHRDCPKSVLFHHCC